jgi:hypothetical protein
VNIVSKALPVATVRCPFIVPKCARTKTENKGCRCIPQRPGANFRQNPEPTRTHLRGGLFLPLLRSNTKLAPKADELVIYYVRPDRNYEPWALWLWALPGGDGTAAWPKPPEMAG